MSIGTVLIVLALIALFGFWSIYPYKTFTFPVQPLKVLTKEVRAGEILSFVSVSCRHHKGTVVVNRSLKNGILVNFPEHRFVQLEIGCEEFINSTVKIPDYVPAGLYVLEINSTIKVNPIRSVSTKITTEPFNVI